MNISSDTFLGWGGRSVIRWRDYVVTWHTSGSREGLVKYSVSDFDKYASEMGEYYGVIE